MAALKIVRDGPAAPEERSPGNDTDCPATLNLSQVAAFLGKHPNTIIRWYKSGKMPVPRKVGAACMWLRESIVEWLKSAECPTG